MNVMMAALAVQLALYSTAWAIFAATFRLYPGVSYRWAGGWALGALGAALLFWLPAALQDMRELLVNTAILGSFTLLHLGMALFARAPARQAVLWVAAVLLGLIEWVHRLDGNSSVLRAWLFALAAAVPLGLTVHDVMRHLRQRFTLRRTVIATLALPLVLCALAFVLRAVVITFSEFTGITQLDTGSWFDVATSMLFLVLLGLFNFSLYDLMLGALINRLEELSSTDQLTGLYNRRFVMERLVEEHARFQRSGQTYAVVMLDLDHFKKVNDTYGHAVGDDVLREVAQRLRQSVRSTDTLARVGGEEFLLLLPMNDVDGALVHAGRIRKRICAEPISTPAASIALTVSLGVAEVLPADANASSVVSRADAALYSAKAAGRNRVECARRATMPGTLNDNAPPSR